MSNPVAMNTPATATGLWKSREAPPLPFPGMSEGLMVAGLGASENAGLEGGGFWRGEVGFRPVRTSVNLDLTY
jgi:hypothetical protein